MGDCWTCGFFQAFDDRISGTTQEIFAAIAPQMFWVMNAAGILWVVVTAGYLIAGQPQKPWQELVVDLARFGMVVAVLQTGALWWGLFDMIATIGFGVGAKAITVFDGTAPAREGIAGLVAVAEKAIRSTFGSQFSAMLSDMSFRNIGNAFLIALLFLVYLALAWQMMKTIVAAYITVFGVGVLSPFVVAAYAFDQTRDMSKGALRLLASAAFQLILSASLLGLVVGMVRDVVSRSLPGPGRGPSGFLLGEDYVIMLVAGAVFYFVYDKLMHVAAQLTQVIEASCAGGYQRAMQAAGTALAAMRAPALAAATRMVAAVRS